MDQILNLVEKIHPASIVLGSGLGLFVGGLLLLIFRPKSAPLVVPMPVPALQPERRAAASSDETMGELQVDVEEDGSSQARFRVANVGSEPVQILAWYAQWGQLGQKGAELLLRSHESLPRTLHARQEVEFSVPIEPEREHSLLRLGVIDNLKNRWSADSTAVLAISNPLKAMPDDAMPEQAGKIADDEIEFEITDDH